MALLYLDHTLHATRKRHFAVSTCTGNRASCGVILSFRHMQGSYGNSCRTFWVAERHAQVNLDTAGSGISDPGDRV